MKDEDTGNTDTIRRSEMSQPPTERLIEAARSSINKALRDLSLAKAFVDAMQDALVGLMNERGVDKLETDDGGNRVVYRRVRKKVHSFDSDMAIEVLSKAGHDASKIGRLVVDESDIIRAFGDKAGVGVLNELRKAGVYKTKEIEYFSLKA